MGIVYSMCGKEVSGSIAAPPDRASFASIPPPTVCRKVLASVSSASLARRPLRLPRRYRNVVPCAALRLRAAEPEHTAQPCVAHTASARVAVALSRCLSDALV